MKRDRWTADMSVHHSVRRKLPTACGAAQGQIGTDRMVYRYGRTAPSIMPAVGGPSV